MTQSLLPKIQALTPYINHTHASCWLHPLAHSTAVVSQYTIGKEIIFPSRDRYELGVSDVQDPHTFLSFALGYCRQAMVGRLVGHLWCLWKKQRSSERGKSQQKMVVDHMDAHAMTG